MEFDDVFSDHVDVCRPESVVFMVLATGKVIQQRVIPDVRYLGSVEWKRNTERARLSGNGKIFQSFANEREYLGRAARWNDKILVRFVVFEQFVLVFGKAKKVILFADFLRLFSVVRTETVLGKVTRLLKTLATDTIQSLVFAQVDISTVKRALEDFLDVPLVRFRCSTDEIGIRNIQIIPDLLVLTRHEIRIRNDLHSSLSRLFYDFLAVFVHARGKFDRIAQIALVPSEDIGDDRAVRITDMRNTVGIVYGGGNEKRSLGHRTKEKKRPKGARNSSRQRVTRKAKKSTEKGWIF